MINSLNNSKNNLNSKKISVSNKRQNGIQKGAVRTRKGHNFTDIYLQNDNKADSKSILSVHSAQSWKTWCQQKKQPRMGTIFYHWHWYLIVQALSSTNAKQHNCHLFLHMCNCLFSPLYCICVRKCYTKNLCPRVWKRTKLSGVWIFPRNPQYFLVANYNLDFWVLIRRSWESSMDFSILRPSFCELVSGLLFQADTPILNWSGIGL